MIYISMTALCMFVKYQFFSWTNNLHNGKLKIHPHRIYIIYINNDRMDGGEVGKIFDRKRPLWIVEMYEIWQFIEPSQLMFIIDSHLTWMIKRSIEIRNLLANAASSVSVSFARNSSQRFLFKKFLCTLYNERLHYVIWSSMYIYKMIQILFIFLTMIFFFHDWDWIK